MTERERGIIELIHSQVKPALGCTEPIAVALAAAKAAELLEIPDRLSARFEISVSVSGNILKNGMGVGVPGTGMTGLRIAAALGAVCGKSAYGLEVLKDLDEASVAHAKALETEVKLGLAETAHVLYVSVKVSCGGRDAVAVIQDGHDNIVRLELCGKLLSDTGFSCGGGSEGHCSGLSVREIYDFVQSVCASDISFILEDRTLNLALAREGLAGDYGLNVGSTIAADEEDFGRDFLAYAMSLTAAASDARMAGCTLPAMSNSGSGNQGITVSMPVIAYALHYDVDDERLSRALCLSNLIAIHIKSHLGLLSALCGCVVASTGAACGICWLKGGTYEQVCATIKNMIGNITGMVCDGAKVGCAMKVASGVSSAVQSCQLALAGHCVGRRDGIIDDDIERSIRNLGRVGSVGMHETDNVILDIMVCK